jgi:hypothetical protein
MSSIQKPSDESHDQARQGGSNAPRRLFGLSLSEAFRQFVLEDPEISALGKMIVEQEGSHVEVFRDGQYPGPIVDFVWPLDVSASDLVFQFVRPVVIMIPGPPIPKGSDAIQRVSSALADRLQSLRRMLIDGQIVAHGTFVNTGTFGPINRLQWARSGLSIDVKSGDLLHEVNKKAGRYRHSSGRSPRGGVARPLQSDPAVLAHKRRRTGVRTCRSRNPLSTS